MTTEFGPMGRLVRVTAISEDGWRVYFDLRDGRTGWFEGLEHDYCAGDVLLLPDDSITEDRNGAIEKVPASTWPDALWIGVVRIKLDDITVIESSGRLRTVPTTGEPHYAIGNTVQAGDAQGVVRILSPTPIKLVDLPAVDEAVIEQFRWSPPEGHTLGFNDFGGLSEVVARARELIEVPLRSHEALSAIRARPIKGVLFTGEPGTGKTMLAQIIASQAEATFYRISGPEIFSKWYGQSELLLRKLFAAAGKDDQAIIFFDEIDSVAAQRGDSSHEVSKRVVAQLLTLMDGFASDANVVVIAATNRPQDLDLALRRPGRFDWEIEFPYPAREDREDILAKTAARLTTQGVFSHSRIAAMTAGWSGADLAAIWSEAALLAVQDNRCAIYDEDYIGGFERISRNRNRLGVSRPNGGDA